MDGHSFIVEVFDVFSNTEEPHDLLSNTYLQQSDAFLICVNGEQDLEHAERQLKEIEQLCVFRPLPVIIVSTKSDVHGDAVEDAKCCAVRLAHEHKCEWMTCSAATGEGVQEVFERSIRMGMFRRLYDKDTVAITRRQAEKHKYIQIHHKCDVM